MRPAPIAPAGVTTGSADFSAATPASAGTGPAIAGGDACLRPLTARPAANSASPISQSEPTANPVRGSDLCAPTVWVVPRFPLSPGSTMSRANVVFPSEPAGELDPPPVRFDPF